MDRKIDDTDWEILKILQKDARIPLTEVAKRLRMATSTVHERVRKMEHSQVILGYRPILNAESLGYSITAYVRVKMQRSRSLLDGFLASFLEVEECHLIAGEDCYILKVRCQTTTHLKNFIEELGNYPEVVSTNTMIVLGSTIEYRPIPSPDDIDASKLSNS